MGQAHATDGLRGGKLLEHFGFAARIILVEVIVHEGSVDARGRDAIAADVVLQVVPGNGVSHGDDGALGHGISETVG